LGLGFRERTFEFCFNAEYCQKNSANLITHPDIPTQNKEKDLGYDVKFKIREGGIARSLFLQHKVPYYAGQRVGSNAKFYDAHNGPYYRFRVDTHQHNTLVKLSRSPFEDTFYCAPIFHSRKMLEQNFWDKKIGEDSIWINPKKIGAIHDNENHNLTYNVNGENPVLHSEWKQIEQWHRASGESAPRLTDVEISNDYIERLSRNLLSWTQESKYERYVTRQLRQKSSLEIAQELLAKVYRVTWILAP